MPLHVASKSLDAIAIPKLAIGAFVGATAYALKIASSGRKSIWEREWAGKMIMIVAPPEPTTLALIHYLLHLPSPPQILYLPPLPSPLPSTLVTLIQTIRVAATNPAAQLHCEPLPATIAGVRDFARKWGAAPRGTTSEEGRRVDAIVLGGAWECLTPDFASETDNDAGAMDLKNARDALVNDDAAALAAALDAPPHRWTPHQYQYFLITSLLPSLLKAPAERDIRIVSLVSPAWPAAVPRLEKQLSATTPDTAPPPPNPGTLELAGARGLTSFFMQSHFRLVLDSLATAAYAKRDVVPDPNSDAAPTRRIEVSSNILALSVVMPWTRDEVVRPVFERSVAFASLLWLLLYPLVLILTPGPTMAVQSILFALSAPVKYNDDDKPKDKAEKEDVKAVEKAAGDAPPKPKAKNESKSKDDTVTDPRRNGIRQGDVVRDCGVIDLPPVLRDKNIARGTYERIEKEVEDAVREYEKAEKEAAANLPKRDTKVKFADEST